MTIKRLDQSGKTPFRFRTFQEKRGDLKTLANQRLGGFSLKIEIASSTKNWPAIKPLCSTSERFMFSLLSGALRGSFSCL